MLTFTQPIGMSDIYLTREIKILRREILFINNMAEGQCVSCKTATKYNCINCSVFVCNRVGCSLAELDESTAGWIAQQSVGYCKSCADEVISDYQEQRNKKPQTESDERSENTNSDESKSSDVPLDHYGSHLRKKEEKTRKWPAERQYGKIQILMI
jgi:sRNA-binding protein